MATTTRLLQVNNLTTELKTPHGAVRLLDHVTFGINAGETFGLVGESGSGKSMTCRSILRILQPPVSTTEGEVLYDGQDILKMPEKEVRKLRGKGISMIFQDPMTSLNPVLTIEQQLMEVLAFEVPAAERRQRAIELLRHVGIPSPEERLKEFPHQFSGGMRQRAMIAIALARNPRLLLADEPTTALDVTIQDQVLELLYHLQQENGMSMILVSHDLGVISQVCDRIAVMYAGEVVEVATKAALFGQPMHPYTLGLMSSMPDLQKSGEWLKPISGMPPSLANLPRGCRFHPRCPFAIDACRREPIPMAEVGPDRFSRCIRSADLAGVREFPEGVNVL
jgi:oligopeptide/dipeptide ABC transporter ATP-binding protein